jgi:uncharacterized protein (UPF0297 family)
MAGWGPRPREVQDVAEEGSRGGRQETRMFSPAPRSSDATRRILETVVSAMEEKGYNPVTQIVGYLLSGDPAYVTSHRGARELILRLERDELVEELVRSYLGRPAER